MNFWFCLTDLLPPLWNIIIASSLPTKFALFCTVKSLFCNRCKGTKQEDLGRVMIAVVYGLRDLRISQECWRRLNRLGYDAMQIGKNLSDGSSGSVVYLHGYFTCTISDFVHQPYWFLCSICEIIFLCFWWPSVCLKIIVSWPQLEFRQYYLFVLEFTLLTLITVETKKEWCKKCLPVFIWHIYFMYSIYEFISWHRSMEDSESDHAWEKFVSLLKWKQRHLWWMICTCMCMRGFDSRWCHWNFSLT